jgi:hypothetical protein
VASLEGEEGEHESLLSATEHARDTASVHLEGTEDADTQVVVRLYVCGCRHGNRPSGSTSR